MKQKKILLNIMLISANIRIVWTTNCACVFLTLSHSTKELIYSCVIVRYEIQLNIATCLYKQKLFTEQVKDSLSHCLEQMACVFLSFCGTELRINRHNTIHLSCGETLKHPQTKIKWTERLGTAQHGTARHSMPQYGHI